MFPIPEVLRRVESAKGLRKYLGREALTQCCLKCQAEVCNPKISACLGLQLKNERQREHYRKKAPKRRAQARRYYRKNKPLMRARSAEYQRDPAVLEVMAAKRRVRYAKRAAEQGRTVRPYRWTAPMKNKGSTN